MPRYAIKVDNILFEIDAVPAFFDVDAMTEHGILEPCNGGRFVANAASPPSDKGARRIWHAWLLQDLCPALFERGDENDVIALIKGTGPKGVVELCLSRFRWGDGQLLDLCLDRIVRACTFTRDAFDPASVEYRAIHAWGNRSFAPGDAVDLLVSRGWLVRSGGTYIAADALEEECVALLAVLKRYWHIDAFRSGQHEAVTALLRGRDAFITMPTGYGKSLCYQLPAVFARGDGRKSVAVVISPLVSLIADQVAILIDKGIRACALQAGDDSAAMAAIAAGDVDIVYLTPEKLIHKREWLQRLHATLGISSIILDEAHCLSEWGHDFRSAYLGVAVVREWVPEVPILCATATATERVRDEVIRVMRLRDPAIVARGLDRPNLHYSVMRSDKHALVRLARGSFGKVIIYAMTRKETEDLATLLASSGVTSACYHAGLDEEARTAAQEAFREGRVRCIVATSSFGMGIDEASVRLLVHWGLVPSLESYLQQVGRAGRDGEPSRCVLFCADHDADRLRNIMGADGEDLSQRVEQSLREMAAYARSSTCFRKQLLACFGEEMALCSGCGNCDEPLPEPTEGDAEGYADAFRTALGAIRDLTSGDRSFGINMYLLQLQGSQSKELLSKVRDAATKTSFGSGKTLSKDVWKCVIRTASESPLLLLDSKTMRSTSGFSYTTFRLSARGESFLAGEALPAFTPPLEMQRALQTTASPSPDGVVRSALLQVPWLTQEQRMRFQEEIVACKRQRL